MLLQNQLKKSDYINIYGHLNIVYYISIDQLGSESREVTILTLTNIVMYCWFFNRNYIR